MSRQMLKVNAKAVITSSAIASTVLTATKACLPPETPFIVIDDKIGSIPEGSIPFDVSIKIDIHIYNKLIIFKYYKTKQLSKNKYKRIKFFRIL